MKATIALLLALAVQVFPAVQSVQAPTAEGHWQIELTFSDSSRHTIRFDAEPGGRGTYVLLDRISSLLDPPEPSMAEWMQPAGTNQLSLSGSIEFPIGNVGRDPGTLVFTGTFDTADSVSGDVAFFRDPKDPTPSKTGTFKAVRVTAQSTPRVELLSPNSGGKLRRGAEVEIEWQATSGFQILAQQILLSLDKGETFTPITPPLASTTATFTWTVPDTLPNVKKALLKVKVINAAGDIGEDVSKQTFKIR
jgi:hypothetical protein